MRVKSKRFPTIEKDMKMVLAHCGSLFLDPASLMQVIVPFLLEDVLSCPPAQMLANEGSVHACPTMMPIAMANNNSLKSKWY